MLNKPRRKVGRYFLCATALLVVSSALVGCNNNATPALGNATPQPPPTNIDPASGKPRTGGAAPGAPGR